MSVQSHLSSLTLVRLLQAWAPAPGGEPPRQDVAQRLGEWLSAADSVQLDGALQAIASYGAARQNAASPQRGQPLDVPALVAACRHAKKELDDLIARRMAAAVAMAPPETDYAAHLQRYQELQKQMEARIAACRAHVRQALSKGSPRLRQLAALDKVMAAMLGEREQKLLSAVPVYLERRFAHWRQQGERGQRPADGDAAADEEGTRRWLNGFGQDMRQVLQADLQVRLQPVLGLIEAAQADSTDSQDGQGGRQMDRHPA